MTEIIIFSDGASKGNPGPGGWGAIVADEATVVELGGSEEQTTNNRMELAAALAALRHVETKRAPRISLYTDSKYVLKGATEWGAAWQMRGWVTTAKQPVLNRDLWEPLLEILTEVEVGWHLIGGHVAIPGNERVDRIASDFAEGKSVELYAGPRSAYPIDVTEMSHDTELHRKKKDSRARSGAKAYSYVSEVDGVVMVHSTWAECEARVKGRRARFKKALSPAEEADIIKAFSRR